MYPTVPPPVFNRERFLSFAMFNGKDIPESVVVKCGSPDGPLEVCLNISKDNDVYQGSVAHRMAARAAISEYEDKMAHRRNNRYVRSYDQFALPLSKAESLELALKYGLVSEQTSFVAIMERPVVDPGTVAVKEVIPQCLNISPANVPTVDRFYSSLRMASSSAPLGAAMSKRAARPSGSMPQGSKRHYEFSKAMHVNPKKNMDEGAEEITRRVGGRAAPAMIAPSMGPMAACSAPPPSCSVVMMPPSMGAMPLSSAPGSMIMAPGEMEFSGSAEKRVRRLKKKLMVSCKSKSAEARSSRGGHPPTKNGDPLLRLCVLQKSDGKFLFDGSLAAALGLAMVEMELMTKKTEFQQLVSNKGGLAVFATVLAVAAMRIKFASSKDVWELQEQKAMYYLALHGVSGEQIFAVGKYLLP